MISLYIDLKVVFVLGSHLMGYSAIYSVMSMSDLIKMNAITLTPL